MKTDTSRLYEAMFLVDPAEAAADWEGINKFVEGILDRAQAEIVSFKKWDERKLAYEIDGKTRGAYLLCYFRADGSSLKNIERDVQLSERIMRVLILRADHISEEDIKKKEELDVPAEKELDSNAFVDEGSMQASQLSESDNSAEPSTEGQIDTDIANPQSDVQQETNSAEVDLSKEDD